MLVHLRVTAPPGSTPAVLDLFEGNPGTASVAVVEGASRRPAGDLVLADVARESADELMAGLRGLHIDRDGTISLENVDTAVSDAAERAEDDAPGDGSDAVIWESVARTAWDDAALSWSFVAFLTLATLLAAIAVVEDSAILVIGAMVVGPEFGPTAAIAVGLVHGRPRLAARAVRTLLLGFAAAVAIVALLAFAGRGLGWIPREALSAPRPQTGFIWRPDKWSAVVAFTAGVAGILSLTSSKSSILVGVFISVTTVPALGNAALALPFWDGSELRGSLEQLAINMGFILLAALLTLLALRVAWRLVPRPPTAPRPRIPWR